MADDKNDGANGAEDMPLPATLTFVLLIGVTFFVLWFGVFALLKERW